MFVYKPEAIIFPFNWYNQMSYKDLRKPQIVMTDSVIQSKFLQILLNLNEIKFTLAFILRKCFRF